MPTTEVVVKGGGANLYEIGEVGGLYTAYKVNVRLLLPNTKTSVGASRSFDGALALIRNHAGEEIKRVG